MAWTVTRSSGRFGGYYRDGSNKICTVGTGDNKKAVLNAAREAERKALRGESTDPAQKHWTFGDYFEQRWIVRRRLELNGRATYWSHYRAGLKEVFGPIKIVRITRSMVQDWIDDMESTGVSPGTIRARYNTLQAVLAAKRGISAIFDGVRDTNPCYGVTLPVRPQREVQIYAPDEVDRLIGAFDEWWRIMILFDTDTGLRWGELIGLRVGDVDFLQRRAVVNQTIVEVSKAETGNGTPYAVKPYPKNEKPRVVGVTKETIEMLSLHVKQRKLKRDDLLFAMPTLKTDREGHTILVPTVARTDVWPQGLPIGRSHFRQVWRRAVRKAKVPMRRRHDLRASYVSWLLDGNLTPLRVMELAGHQSWNTTRRYAKSLDGTEEAGVEAIRSIRARYREQQQDGQA